MSGVFFSTSTMGHRPVDGRSRLVRQLRPVSALLRFSSRALPHSVEPQTLCPNARIARCHSPLPGVSVMVEIASVNSSEAFVVSPTIRRQDFAMFRPSSCLKPGVISCAFPRRRRCWNEGPT